MAPFINRQKQLLLAQNNLLLAAAALIRARRKKRNRASRRWWVHPISQLRPTLGEYHHLYEQLRQDEEKLATGNSFKSLGFSFRIAHNTISLIVKECCQAIWEELNGTYLKCPSTDQEWKSIAQEFWEKTQFPNCAGCIDGKHCILKKPRKSGSLYYNYKGTFSTVLLAVCDARYRFSYIDVGSYGHNNDAGIYGSSSLSAALENNCLNLPPPSFLPGTQVRMPYVLIGDGAFPLKPYILTPFPGQNLPADQDIFNYRLSRCRRMIENTFGISACMWRVLFKPMETHVENADATIKAVCCLHNFLVTEEVNADLSPTAMADRGNDDNGIWRVRIAALQQNESNAANALPQSPSIQPRNAHDHSFDDSNIRANYVTFFQGVGTVPWQNRRMNVLIN